MKTYKATIRVPTNMYAYFEVEMEGTPQEIIDGHNELDALYKASQNAPEGLTAKVFDQTLDKYLSGGGMDSDAYAAMNKQQIDLVQTLKRSLARIKRRTQPEESDEIN